MRRNDVCYVADDKNDSGDIIPLWFLCFGDYPSIHPHYRNSLSRLIRNKTYFLLWHCTHLHQNPAKYFRILDFGHWEWPRFQFQLKSCYKQIFPQFSICYWFHFSKSLKEYRFVSFFLSTEILFLLPFLTYLYWNSKSKLLVRRKF